MVPPPRLPANRTLSETRECLTCLETIHENLALSLKKLGYYTEAEACYEECISIRRKRLDAQHPALASSLVNYGDLRMAMGNYDAAADLYHESLAIRRRYYKNEHRDIAWSLSKLGIANWRNGNLGEAEELFRECLAMYRRILGDGHPQTLGSMGNLAGTIAEQGRMAEAVVLAREALQISQRVLGPEHRRTLLAEHNLVDALDKSGNTCEAAQLHSENVEAQLRAIHEVSRGLASATLTLTLRLVDTGDCDAGESLLQNSLKLGELTLQDNDWRLGAIKSVLGECLTTLGRYEEAGPLVVESYPVIRAEYGDGHAETRNALQRIIRLYEAWGKPDKAAEYRALLPETPDTDLEER